MSITLHTTPIVHAFRMEHTIRSAATAHAVRSTAVVVWSFFDALCDGFAAYRRFEHLKRWGISHDKALKMTLGHRADAK